MTKNTKATIWAIVAVMTVIVGITTYERQRPKRPVVYEASVVVKTVATVPDQTQIATSTEISTSTPIIVATSTATPTPIIKKFLPRKPKPVAPKALSYGDAVSKYSNYRIQFNSICQAIPGRIVFANLTTIMLDNRSDGIQKISLAGQTYVVEAYGYALVTLNQKALPITLHVNCNNQMNSLQIVLE